ncbi:MAG: hypothetical protein ACOX6D_05710 [Thermoguttaceae bacterium]
MFLRLTNLRIRTACGAENKSVAKLEGACVLGRKVARNESAHHARQIDGVIRRTTLERQRSARPPEKRSM